MEKKTDIVVLANGLFPSGKHALGVLEAAGKIICCDGAADKLIAHGLTPDIIAGDLDSVSEDTMKKHAGILHRSGEQESNDLTKAVRYCMAQGYPGITILGATGHREDHALGNISLMLEYYPHIRVKMITDFGEFFLLESGQNVASYPGEQISIFSVDNKVKVSSDGLKFPLNKLRLANWYIASLNESLGNSFSLVFDSEHPLIVFRAWPQ